MQPTLRLTNYADEYQKLVYDDYAEWSNVIYATYYKLDYDNTIFDENYVQTYRRTGELSGRKWNKIYMMPITFIQQVLPAMNSSERGVNYAQDIQTSIVIDPSTNITPAVGDILHFNISGDYVYWNIINVERSAALNKVYYRCSIEQFRPFSDWEDYNISGEYIYIEYLKSILPYAQGNNFLILLSRLEHVINYLNSIFHPNICTHLNSNKESYPEIDFILNTYMTIVPPNVTLISEKYIDHIVDNSVFNLLFLPDMFTSDIINFNFVKSNYNPRIKLFLDYKEYVTTTSISNANTAVMIYRNGLLQTHGLDYVINANVVQFLQQCNFKDIITITTINEFPTTPLEKYVYSYETFFIATSNQKIFDLSNLYKPNNIILNIYRNGLFMLEGEDYTFDITNKKLIFNYDCNQDDIILVHGLYHKDSAVNILRTNKKSFISISNQTIFDISDIYDDNVIDMFVYRNGLYQSEELDYIIDINAKNIIFNYFLPTNDIITILCYYKLPSTYRYIKINTNVFYAALGQMFFDSNSIYDIDIIESFYPDKIMEARLCINTFKEATHNTSLDIPTQDDLKLSLLLKEFLYFLNLTDPVNDIQETSSDIIATNLLEAALEFVIVSRKLYPLSQVSIKFNTEGTDDE